MKKPRVSEQLYYRLPNIYRLEDAKVKGAHPLPLKRFLQVLGTGFDFLEDKIEGLINLYDIDNCPVEFLDKIVETMGFKFPYALPENEQRRFVKILPRLYKTKGTIQSFEYLAREIFGTKSSTRAYKQEYKKGMTAKEWRRIFVEITTDGEQLNLGRKEEYFRKFAELVRPVNTILVVLLMVYYSDFYNRLKRTSEEEDVLKVFENFKNENYRFNIFIDGVDTRIGGHHLVLSDDLDYAFILNKSHLYSNQHIELVDTIKEEILADLMQFCTYETYDRGKFSDLLLPFNVNRTHLNNSNFGLGYYSDYIEKITDTVSDDLSIIVRDVFSRDIMTISGDDLDSYRHRNFVNNIDVCDMNHNLLTRDRETAFHLNSDHTYNSQKIKSYDVIKEEFCGFTVGTKTEEEEFDFGKVTDYHTPFTLGVSALNNHNYGMEGFINEGTIRDILSDKSTLRSNDSEEGVIELKDIYAFTDNYRDDVLVDKASVHDIENPFFLTQDEGSLFTLNHTKTYGKQEITKSSKLIDEHLDRGYEKPFVDKVMQKVKDYEYPFTVNCSALSNKNWNLGYEKLTTESINIRVDEEKYTRRAKDILVSTSMRKSAQYDSYKSNIIVNNSSIFDIENELILGDDSLPSMKLNSARTFGAQTIKVKKDIKEESKVTSFLPTEDDRVDKKVKDNDYPFTINHSSTNNLSLHVAFEKDTADNINPRDEDNAKKKLTDELLVEEFSELTDEKFIKDIIYTSSSHITYTRSQSTLGSTISTLGSHFFTNDVRLFSNLAY